MSESKTVSDPRKEWDSAVKDLTDRGVAKSAAVQQVVKSKPELHRAYIDAVNGTGAKQESSASAGHNSPTDASAISTWNNSIQAMVGGGMSKAAAVQKLVATNPDLHQAYLAQVNGRVSTTRDSEPSAKSSPSGDLSPGGFDATHDSATSRWNAALEAMAGGGQITAQHVERLVRDDSTLHAEYVTEANGRSATVCAIKVASEV